MRQPRHPLRATWNGMKQRCFNRNHFAFHNYGGRGITVCPRWLVFKNFVDDLGVRPNGCTLDRINNDGNYEPSNCRWATPHEQRSNTRLRGALLGSAKLTDFYVKRMREIRTQTGLSYKKIGAIFGVSKPTAMHAILGETWGHVE